MQGCIYKKSCERFLVFIKRHEIQQNAKRIQEKVNEILNEKLKNADYGSLTYAFSELDKREDIHEFISEAFSNPILIDVLKQIPSEGNKSNLFKDFINALKIILGFNNDSIIEDILHYSEEAFIKDAIKGSAQQKQQAIEVYTQYLQSLEKPDINPILQDKEEQVKKFVELQERLNNKEFVKSAKNVYDNSKELQELGTQEQYIDFIARVALGIVRNPSSGEFNDSKVTDVVYHGTDKDFKDFDKSFKKSNRERALSRDDLGFYFTKQKEFADIFKDEDFNKTFFKDKKLSTLSAIVNVNSPYSIDNIFELNDVETYASEKDFDLGNGTFTKSSVLEEIENNFESGKNDALITKGGLYKDEAIYDYVIVKNPEQIHILSSKQDTEGFKQHVSTVDDMSENNKDTYYQKVTDTVSPFEQMSKTDQVAFEKTVRDLAARMSDRIGIPYKIINNVNEKYKGKLSNGTAYINLAYCDMSTISHEVLGHSIIRALKNKSELSFKEQLNKEVYQGNIEKKC